MTKVVKFALLGIFCIPALLVGFAVGEQVFLARAFYKQSTEALVQLHDLRVKFSLQASVPAEQASGFKQMVKSQAVFKTKLREFKEMKADLGESLKKSGLYLDKLSLDENSVIPEFSSTDESLVGSELSAAEVYEPKPEDTFTTQSWIAKIHAPKNVSKLVQSWLKRNKESGNIALIADKVSVEKGKVLLHFKTGMIPAMKMPKRVLNIHNIKLPDRIQGFTPYPVPDLMNYQAKAHSVADKFNTLKAKIEAEAPKLLQSIENADKSKWLWMASLKSKEFIEQSKAQQ